MAVEIASEPPAWAIGVTAVEQLMAMTSPKGTLSLRMAAVATRAAT
jgi:hypothetical protein